MIYRLRVGPEPRFEYVNPAVESLLGYTPEDFYAEPGLVMDVLHIDDRPRARELGRDGTAKALTLLLRMTRRDGIMIWTEHRVGAGARHRPARRWSSKASPATSPR